MNITFVIFNNTDLIFSSPRKSKARSDDQAVSYALIIIHNINLGLDEVALLLV